jgi:alpha-mannosidase
MIHFTGGEVRASQSRPTSITQMDDALGTRLRIEAPFVGGVRIQEIELYHQLRRIDFTTELCGFPGHDGMLVAVIPLRTNGSPKNLYETHNAVTERPDGIYDAQTWVDLEDGDGAVALLNQGTGGHQIAKGVVTLILLRSITHYTGYYTPSASEAGNHTFKYSLLSHAGDWARGEEAEQGHSFNSPLVMLSTDAHTGSLPSVHGFAARGGGHLRDDRAEEGGA